MIIIKPVTLILKPVYNESLVWLYRKGRTSYLAQLFSSHSLILIGAMERPLWVRWLRVWAVGGAIIGAGALLFKYTTPTDEQLINSLSPELRLQYERERNLRQAEQKELMKIVKETSQSDRPIWDTGAIQSPWEKNVDPQSKGRQNFEQLKAEQVQKEELDRIRNELTQIREQTSSKTGEIVQGKNKSWWKLW